MYTYEAHEITIIQFMSRNAKCLYRRVFHPVRYSFVRYTHSCSFGVLEIKERMKTRMRSFQRRIIYEAGEAEAGTRAPKFLERKFAVFQTKTSFLKAVAFKPQSAEEP